MKQTHILVQMYHKHEEWARSSGFAPMDWNEFKVSRLANPNSLYYIQRKKGA